jgi:hypothetical protein
MNKTIRSCFNFFLSILTCVLVVSLSTLPALSKDGTQAVQLQTVSETTDAQFRSTTAQRMVEQSMKRYSVNLTSSKVVPNAPSTSAMGMAEAMLTGNRLMVRGSFEGLSSTLRDYVADPTNPPNPKITSAVHIHRGEATQNGPFQFALVVMMNDMGMGGKFRGEYTLSTEQLQALADGQLYIDLHTKQNRAGELRGYFRPA